MGLFEKILNGMRRRRSVKELVALRSLTVGEIMTKYLITVKPNDDVVKAATKMIAEDISCLIVIDGESLAGVISERDFLLKVPLTKKVFDMRVREIMKKDPVICPPTTKAEDAVKMMIKAGVRRVIVVNGTKPIGIVTQTDFTRAISKHITAYPDVPEMKVEHYMTSDVLCVTSEKSVADAKQAMLKRKVGAVIIIDAKERTPVGIFTEYDVVMQFYDQHGKLEMKDIGAYMRKYVRAAPRETSVMEANRLMLEKNMRRLMIVEGDKMVGIMTQTDICRKFFTEGIDVFNKSIADPALKWKRLSTALHGEFKTEHLKVYDHE